MAETIRSPQLGLALGSFMQRQTPRGGALAQLVQQLDDAGVGHFPFALALLSTQSCAAVRSSRRSASVPAGARCSALARALAPMAERMIRSVARVSRRGRRAATTAAVCPLQSGRRAAAPIRERGGSGSARGGATTARAEGSAAVAPRRRRRRTTTRGGGWRRRARASARVDIEDVREQVVRQHLVEERRAAPPRPLAAREGEAPRRRAQRRAPPPQRAPRRRRARAPRLGGGGGGGGLSSGTGSTAFFRDARPPAGFASGFAFATAATARRPAGGREVGGRSRVGEVVVAEPPRRLAQLDLERGDLRAELQILLLDRVHEERHRAPGGELDGLVAPDLAAVDEGAVGRRVLQSELVRRLHVHLERALQPGHLRVVDVVVGAVRAADHELRLLGVVGRERDVLEEEGVGDEADVHRVTAQNLRARPPRLGDTDFADEPRERKNLPSVSPCSKSAKPIPR